MDLDLDTLKREIEEYLGAAGFAVFHSSPGGLEGMPMVLWDTARYPDYQLFLEVARKAGIHLVIFAAREFTPSDLDDLLEQVEAVELDRDEQREYQSRLRDLRPYEGSTCALELAFDYNSRLYVYELQPDWYEEYLNVEEEIASHLAGVETDGGDNFGYFSKY